MLRDVISALPEIGTWPCDEINYVWRYGNARRPSDILTESDARPNVVRYIRRCFDRQRQAADCRILVEKTCANSLRVPFVRQVVPEARFIFLHRDPVDVVASAMVRWRAPLELRYTLAKARFVPIAEIPYYGIRFIENRLRGLLSREGRLASWGPRLEDMDTLVREHTLAEICALQWRECVRRSSDALADVAPDRLHIVSYEDFVKDPQEGFADVCRFLGVAVSPRAIETETSGIRRDGIGKGRATLADQDLENIDPLLEPGREAIRTLQRRRTVSPHSD
jgi:hypothetical protein